MKNFIVSARKYRPLSFKNVVGQDHIIRSLENAIASNHLGQALLFCGPRGVGKTTCARILAKQINTFTDNENHDFNIFELDAASNNSVEDIRNLIEQVRIPPQIGKFKIYIIDEVHMLSNQAFNAFLKTLEEPPSYAIFILATTEKHKVIPTILSRCQIYDFDRISNTSMISHLDDVAKQEKIATEYDALNLIVQKADGSLRDALSMFDLITTFSKENKITYRDTIKNLHLLDHEYYFRLINLFLMEDISNVLLLYHEVLKKGFEGTHFLTGIQEHLRNLLVASDKKLVSLLPFSEELKSKLLKQSASCNHSFLLSAMSIANEFELNFKSSNNQRLHVELCLMKICHLNSLLELKNIEDLQKDSKKKNPEESDGHEVRQKSVSNDEISLNTPSPLLDETLDASKLNTIIKPTTHGDKTTPNKFEDVAETAINLDTPNIFSTSKKTNASKQVNIEKKKNNPFTQEDLNRHWEHYKEENKKIPETYRIIYSKKLIKKEENNILIYLHSELEASFLNAFEINMIQYLRRKMENDHLHLLKEFHQSEKKAKLYTNKDKLKYMKNKNPELKKLESVFGLDIDV